jgi:cobalt-zinc-cadmium efflux system outer membrane protein
MRKPSNMGNLSESKLLGLLCLAMSGCAYHSTYVDSLSPSLAPHAVQLPPSESEAHIERAAPTSLEDLLALATRAHPELRAARARVEAAQGLFIQAGLYPNPMIGPHFDELGSRGGAWGEVGIKASQTVVTAGKLRLAQAAAAEGVAAADWQALARWYLVVTRVRLAYVDLLSAQRERDALQEITRLAKDIAETSLTLEKAGKTSRPDVLRAKVELEQQTLQKTVADRKIEAAGRALAAAVGVTELSFDALRGNLEQAPPARTWDAVVERTLAVSADLQEARAVIAQQEKLLRKAEADAVPNVNVDLMPFYSDPDRRMHGEVLLMAGVPIFNRNEGNIQAARADLARARADEQAVALRLRERLAAAYQRFEAARLQVEAYQKRILPDAREALRLVQIAYGLADPKTSYTALLQTQQALFQAQLAQVQALGDWQRAAAELAGLAQLDD